MVVTPTALFHTAPRQVALSAIELPPLGVDDIRAKAICSGVSPGTEGLVFSGQIEPGTALDASLEALKDGVIHYPFAYGYCWVGTVEAIGSGVTTFAPGDRIFTFAPHQSHIVTSASSCIAVPKALSTSAATLLPSMETAVSIVQDTKPLLGENIRIFGQGLVGILTAWILNKFPLGGLSAIEPNESRIETSHALGISAAAPVKDLPQVDATIEVSGNPAALEQAIQSTKPHGRVIVASWYGSQKNPLSLNTHFHRGRLRIVSSQVSSIAPELRGLWSHQRRMQQAIHLLGEFPYDALSAQRIPFTQAPDSYPPLFSDGRQSLHPYFEYNKD